MNKFSKAEGFVTQENSSINKAHATWGPDFEHYYKKTCLNRGVVSHSCNLSAEQTETDWSFGIAAQPAKPTQGTVDTSDIFVSHTKVENWGAPPEVNLRPSYTHIQKLTCILPFIHLPHTNLHQNKCIKMNKMEAFKLLWEHQLMSLVFNKLLYQPAWDTWHMGFNLGNSCWICFL